MADPGAKVWTIRTACVLRWLSLSILFGGSAAIVFAAITLVKAAEAQGVPVAEAARANAPVFTAFSKVALGAAAILLLAEALDFAVGGRRNRLVLARYLSSLLCVATAMIFALGIVPPMEELRKSMCSDPQARATFKQLHEISRLVFGAQIFLAMVSLVIPALEMGSTRKADET